MVLPAGTAIVAPLAGAVTAIVGGVGEATVKFTDAVACAVPPLAVVAPLESMTVKV